MEGNNSKEVLLSILGVAVLIIAVIGISFAAFNFSQTGAKENKITTGRLSMSYSEDTNGISLENALPISDETGKALINSNEIFDFTVDAIIEDGDADTVIDYAITAVKVDEATTLDDSAVKVYLTNIDTSTEVPVLEPTKLSLVEKTTSSELSSAPSGEFKLATGKLNDSATHKYRLRMWVADDYSAGGTSATYQLKVNVYGAAQAQ